LGEDLGQVEGCPLQTVQTTSANVQSPSLESRGFFNRFLGSRSGKKSRDDFFSKGFRESLRPRMGVGYVLISHLNR
jgi:hypothetical protein